MDKYKVDKKEYLHKIVLQLKANPIFNMSLSSKELFHSNFWAWLFEKDNNFIEIFFTEFLDKNKVTKVTREEKNRDITIWAKNEKDELKAYVIENKFKAMPREKQLKDYKTNLGNEFEKGILSGNNDEEPYFMDDDWKEDNKWDYISYIAIAVGINKLSSLKLTPFEKLLVDEYASMLLMLTKYINNYTFSNEKWEWETDDDPKMIKMDDIILKRKANELEDYLRKNVIKELKIDNGTRFNVNIRSAYYHKRPNVETYYYKKNEADNEDEDGVFQIGVQIEAGDFRRFIKIKKKLSTEDMDKKFIEFVGLEWFEDFKKDTKKIFSKKTRMSPKNGNYNKYTTNDYTFIYQYWNIEDTEMKSIAKDIKDNMKKAKVILNSDIVKKICEIQ